MNIIDNKSNGNNNSRWLGGGGKKTYVALLCCTMYILFSSINQFNAVDLVSNHYVLSTESLSILPSRSTWQERSTTAASTTTTNNNTDNNTDNTTQQKQQQQQQQQQQNQNQTVINWDDNNKTPASKSKSNTITNTTKTQQKQQHANKINWNSPLKPPPILLPTSPPTFSQQEKEKKEEAFFFSDYKNAWQDMEDHPTAGFIGQHAFSAAWWQSRDLFLRYKKVEKISASPEGASFEVFDINEENMRVTRDWMDLNVEHMSKWWKTVLDDYNSDPDKQYLERILNIFENYVYSKDRVMFWDSLDMIEKDGTHSDDWLDVAQSTIAVIAFMPYEERALTKWSLSATLMSLVQIGVGRIVVSGESSKESKEIVQEAFDEVRLATKDWKTSTNKELTGFEFCVCANATPAMYADDGPNIPKAALKRLRHVFLNKKNGSKDKIRKCWAGGPTTTMNTTNATRSRTSTIHSHDTDIMSRWKYVYLGEPDLILNTRPSSTAMLGKALKAGGVLAPHRLQPTPHASDFFLQQQSDQSEPPDIKEDDGIANATYLFLIPNIPPKFNRVIDVDHYNHIDIDKNNNISCCDAGNQKPFSQFEDCGTWWWNCGFETLRRNWEDNNADHLLVNKTIIMNAHRMGSLYPFMRLKRGTGVVFVGSESGRMCRPTTGSCSSNTSSKTFT